MIGFIYVIIIAIGYLTLKFLYSNEKALYIARVIVLFICAIGFLIISIVAEAYLMLIGFVGFIIWAIWYLISPEQF